MAKRKGGLDALFNKVFAGENVQGAISALHAEYPDPPSSPTTAAPPATAVSINVQHTDNISTEEIASNQAIRQSNEQTDKQTSFQSVKETVSQAIKQSTEQPDKQSYQHYSRQAEVQTIEQTTNQTIEQTIRHVQKQTNKQTNKQVWLPLNENQGRILLFLYERGNGLTNMDIVCLETGVAYGTARAAIDTLMREGYVTYKERHNGHAFRGFEYGLDNHLCSMYASRVRSGGNDESPWQAIKQANKQVSRQSNEQSVGIAIKQTIPPFSSSRNELKTTTTENGTTDDLLKDPELGYWREKGVNNRQINAWSEEFQMPVDQVLQSLRYCRFDMVVLNQEEEKQISNPMNWFYKVMQRSGLYPKPSSYKTLAEIRAEQMEQAARDAAEARERQAAAEQELAFQKLMSNPDSEEYRRLLASVDAFAKDVGGKVLETALREAFRVGAV